MIVEKIFIGKIPCVVYKPNSFDPSKKYPVWFFFHGQGEMGDGSAGRLDTFSKNTNHAGLLAAAEARGFIVVAPQLVQSLNDWIPGWTDKYQSPVFDWVYANLPCDMTRIAVTGLSLGGGGVWVAISGPNASKIAVAIPVCGTPETRDYSIPAREKIPVWAYHAKNDTVVGYVATVNQVNAINDYNPVVLAQMTLYETGGHWIWGTVYGDSKMYDWALSKTNNTAVPVPKTPTIFDGIANTLFFSDGSNEPVLSALTDLKTKVTTFKTATQTYVI